MTIHWTERSTKDYHFRIAADFIAQLEERMESEGVTQKELSELTKLSKSRISQVINNPGNLTVGLIVKFARALGMKVSLVAYDDGDPENTRGPINSEIFKTCWEDSGKPLDMWAFENTNQASNTNIIQFPLLPPGQYLQDFHDRASTKNGEIKTEQQLIVQI